VHRRGHPEREKGSAPRRFLTLALLLLGACRISEQREIAIGRSQAEQVDRQLPLVTDSEVGAYIQSLGERLASNTSRPDLPWRFQVVDSKDVNAFALPGGFVYVNRGLIESADSMDELAGALGHEIGHVVRRHSVQQLERVGGMKLGIALVCAATNACDSRSTRLAIDAGSAAWLAHNSRAAEAQADSEAIGNVIRANIDPEGIPRLFRLLLDTRRSRPNLVTTFFASHPLEESRIEQTRAIIGRYDPLAVRDLQRDEESFQRMRSRLIAADR
jgi:predicted Zn-dependent protease